MQEPRRLSGYAGDTAPAAGAGEGNRHTLGELAEAFSGLRANINRVIVGKDEVVRLVLAAMISRGHVLLEDIPGVGKTTLAKSIARSIDASYSRIQFTPDLLPSDITGSTVYSPRDERFYWSEGPLFANIVLADEINRTSPRTQAALLEAMEEQQVTVDHETHQLPSPFFVIATQNPHELHGTFPLPEGQSDRFLVSVSLGLPGRSNEIRMIREQLATHPLEGLKAVIDCHQILQLQLAVRQVKLADRVLAYIMNIIEATRRHEEIGLGASPRASLAMARLCQSLAFTDGRAYVTPDDVQAAAVPVLAHRLVFRQGTRKTVAGAAAVVEEIVSSCQVPV